MPPRRSIEKAALKRDIDYFSSSGAKNRASRIKNLTRAVQNFKKYTKTNYFYLELVFKISLQSSITLNQNYTSKSGGSGNEVWTLTWKSFQEPESAFGLHHLVDEPEGAALRERS